MLAMKIRLVFNRYYRPFVTLRLTVTFELFGFPLEHEVIPEVPHEGSGRQTIADFCVKSRCEAVSERIRS